MQMPITANDLNVTLDTITRGRVSGDARAGKNPFVVTKSSGIPGKAVTETPGLVWGRPDQELKKVAVMMTLTESAIELAGATGVDAIIAHHPIADASNSGGVLLRTYLDLYNLSVFELHEAFHGLHPGIAFLHGHDAGYVNISYSNIPGNILFVGDTLKDVSTLGDILSRLDRFMDFETETQILENERRTRNCNEIMETAVCTRGVILEGLPDKKINKIMHIFPHTGFTPVHMERVVKEHPMVDTVLASISRVFPEHALVEKARELGLNFICGNSHALEIMENGLPLARAIKMLLPDLDVVIFKERMTSIPLERFGGKAIQDYAENMAQNYLAGKQG
ncbi:MAG: Nif3-like dinuclear metal center hexameric protein [Desulfotignum sp.]|nr:Nif3-like dinuclear metal center hexameric protein [Desulfotignum sp.]